MSLETAIMIEAARLSLSGALVGIGLVFMVGGGVGVLRFPDFYTRLHAVGVSDGVGGSVLLLGLALATGDAGVALRLVLLATLIIASAPTVSHMAANAAHAAGLAPLAGSYTAPRPGVRAPR